MEIHAASLWRFRVVDWIAKDRRANVGHVDAELVGAARARLELYEAEAVVASDNFIFSDSFAAVFVGNEGSWLLEIARKRNIDECMRLLWRAADYCVVGLVGLALGKLILKLRFSCGVLGDNNYARGITV